MKNISKPAGMDRREFIHLTGGLLLSVAASQTAGGAAADEVRFVSHGFAHDASFTGRRCSTPLAA